MSNAKTIFVRKAAALSLPLLLYLIASLHQSQFWGNIISPVNALACAGILLFAYLRSPKKNTPGKIFLLYSLACFAWGIADILWAILEATGSDPGLSPLIWIIYGIPNLFIALSLFVFAVAQFGKWNFVQICVDSIIVCLMSLVFIWIVYLNKDAATLALFFQSDFTSLFSVISDIVILTGVLLWFLSVRSGKIPGFLYFIAGGGALYALTDMLYYYIDFNGLYVPNSLIDIAYALSLYILAMGALCKIYMSGTALDMKAFTNIGPKSRWLYLLAFPLFTLLLDVLGSMDIHVSVVDMSTYLILILLYRAFSKYVQLSLENEMLLKKEILANESLEQRVQEQVKELQYLANQDTLTKLFNRRYFMNRLEDIIPSLRLGESLALLIIDLDRFKTINDSFGHDAGDQVLNEMADRMTGWNRIGATVARLGGDEFGFIISGRYTVQDIAGFCSQITGLCSKPILVGGHALSITISIGVALLSKEAGDGKTLMKNADIAMYQAKAQGYNRYQFFDADFSQSAINSNMIEVLLQQADIEKDFELFYQPQFSLPGKKLVGAEALLRWKHKEHGYIPPGVFIPVAENIEHIAKIGEWVLKEAIRQSIAWNSLASQPVKIGINISPRQFNAPTFPDSIKTLIRDTGVNTAWLDAEITEGTMIGQTEQVKAGFALLKELGLTISIDDFGSGYSAISSLNKYPFDRIKIDKSLIDNISLYNISGVHIVKSIIQMAKSIGIQTIAEGVETDDQLDILTGLSCDQVQGYLLGRPVPARDFERMFLQAAEGGAAPHAAAPSTVMPLW